ncbi:MAG: SDR family oxidoreductase [Xanthomonadales bacterium]|nr:SDR family oxidoreductase [Xanthomonadales bacterium]
MSEPQPLENRHLFCFGCGYVAQRLARVVQDAGGQVSGTSRTQAGADALGRLGIAGHVFDGAPLPARLFDPVTDILCAIPPGPGGDDGVLTTHGDMLAGLPNLEWAGLLSTTGVYGDTGGAWVDEDSPLRPGNARAQRRAEAERRWLAWGAQSGSPVQIFRLSGIYGPRRSPFDRLREGSARRIIKPGQVFNRIHVDDIVAALWLGMQHPDAGPVFNLADDAPASADEVLVEAARLLNMTPPPAVPIEEAQLSSMAQAFYDDNKRVSNQRARQKLGLELRYPSYREGLRAILDEESVARHRG